jgi:hypothetical protein
MLKQMVYIVTIAAGINTTPFTNTRRFKLMKNYEVAHSVTGRISGGKILWT